MKKILPILLSFMLIALYFQLGSKDVKLQKKEEYHAEIRGEVNSPGVYEIDADETLEDLIEEIVGDIHEEYEEVEPDIQEIVPHKVFRVSGSISLFDLNEEMHLHIDSTCDTLSGYLMEILGYIPDQEKLPLLVETPEADFEVESMDDRVIDKVKLTLKENKEAEPKEDET